MSGRRAGSQYRWRPPPEPRLPCRPHPRLRPARCQAFASLGRLAFLHQQGTLTDEEFAEAKQRMLRA